MPLDREPPPRGREDDGLIWAREDVVVTSGVSRTSDVFCYYIKLNETEEIFELGELEYAVWEQFEGGRSLAAAEEALLQRQGVQFRAQFRQLVAELATRGLLHGAVPREWLAEFAAGARARQIRLQHQVDPDGRSPRFYFNRIILFDPNRPFLLLSRWFGFLKYSVWPIVFAAGLGALVLIKHLPQLAVDIHTLGQTGLVGWGIPHILVMLFTIKLLRNIVEASVIRHYGAEIRMFSLDFIFGFWPRFHIDKKALLRLKREPQLWAHGCPTFVRLFFFGFGAIGWWYWHGDGTMRSELSLLMCRSGLLDMAISALPFRRGAGKNETYYWICCYFDEPFLRERAIAALRTMFSSRTGVFDVNPVERTALFAYALSMIASIVLAAFVVINLVMTLTGEYRGAGAGFFLACCLVVGGWKLAARSVKRSAVAERRGQKRPARSRLGGPQPAPAEG